MADFETWDTDNGGASPDHMAGAGTRQIRGGMLDPSTFPSPWPPLWAPTAAGIGLRHIDPYPGMNYAPPGGYARPSVQDLHDFLNGLPLPKDAFGPHITFINDEKRNPSPDLPVRNALATMIERGVVDSGFNSVNINSTTGGHPGSTGNHPPGYAVDMNNINGFRVIDRPDLASRLQDVFQRQPEIRENFGPAYQTKTERPGQAPHAVAKVKEDHRNHDHFSAQR